MGSAIPRPVTDAQGRVHGYEGLPCIRGMRTTVGTILGLLASGKTIDEVLDAYPHVERDDVLAALSYAAWRAEEVDVPLVPGIQGMPSSTSIATRASAGSRRRRRLVSPRATRRRLRV